MNQTINGKNTMLYAITLDDNIFYECDPKIHKTDYHIGILSKTHNPYGLCMPCCFKQSSVDTKNAIKKKLFEDCINGISIGVTKKESTNDKYLYILGNTIKLQDSKMGMLPNNLDLFLNKINNYTLKTENNILKATDSYMVKYGPKNNDYSLFGALNTIFNKTSDEIISRIEKALKINPSLFMSANNENKPADQDVELRDVADVEREHMNTAIDGDDIRANESGDDVTEEKTGIELELEEAKAKADENWDKFLRLQADMDNLRRRKDIETEDARKFAVKRFAENLLPVIDSLEMGLSVDGDLAAIREGMEMTKKQFLSALHKNHVKVISPEGKPFDPEFHQAMTMQPSKDHKDNEVITVMQKGYSLNGRLIRPAMVMVCKN